MQSTNSIKESCLHRHDISRVGAESLLGNTVVKAKRSQRGATKRCQIHISDTVGDTQCH